MTDDAERAARWKTLKAVARFNTGQSDDDSPASAVRRRERPHGLGDDEPRRTWPDSLAAVPSEPPSSSWLRDLEEADERPVAKSDAETAAGWNRWFDQRFAAAMEPDHDLISGLNEAADDLTTTCERHESEIVELRRKVAALEKLVETGDQMRRLLDDLRSDLCAKFDAHLDAMRRSTDERAGNVVDHPLRKAN
jgi:hypothetical protein